MYIFFVCLFLTIILLFFKWKWRGLDEDCATPPVSILSSCLIIHLEYVFIWFEWRDLQPLIFWIYRWRRLPVGKDLLYRWFWIVPVPIYFFFRMPRCSFWTRPIKQMTIFISTSSSPSPPPNPILCKRLSRSLTHNTPTLTTPTLHWFDPLMKV